MKKFILLLSATILLFACKKEETATDNASVESIAQYSTANAVLTGDNLDKQLFIVDAGKGAVVKGKNGTKLTVPKNAFTDSEGNIITGKVDIELKEAITRADIVLAGLTTTSNGELLESGGMVYVNATAEGKPVYIAPQKDIEVSVPANKWNDKMLIFKGEQDADTGAINWIDPQNIIAGAGPAKSTIVKGSETNAAVTDEFYSGDTLIIKPFPKPIAPVKPAKATEGDSRIISLELAEPDEFPELKKFNNVDFKLADDTDYNPADAKREWASVDIKKAKEQGYYILTFKAYEGGKEIARSYKAIPALKGKDLEIAMAEYNKKMKEYEDESKRYEEKRRKEEIERKNREKERIAAVEAKFKRDSNINEYVYGIKQFGWSNIDMFYKDPSVKTIELLADVKDKFRQDLINVSLVLANKNVFISGYLDSSGKFIGQSMPTLKLPLNEPVLLLATAKVEGKSYYSIQKLSTAKSMDIPLQFKQATAEELKAVIKKEIGI